MMKFSDLEYSKVQTKSGKDLGIIFSIEGQYLQLKDRIERIEITTLICGSKSILERIGIKKPKERKIPWSDVLEIKKELIIVKDKKN